jgi:hypothetical protein
MDKANGAEYFANGDGRIKEDNKRKVTERSLESSES